MFLGFNIKEMIDKYRRKETSKDSVEEKSIGKRVGCNFPD